jgi:ATP-dependent DNA helicase RecG
MVRFLHGGGVLSKDCFWRIDSNEPAATAASNLQLNRGHPHESLASLMRRLNICEERGSGIDKVILNVELYQLPAPEFLVTESHTKIILYAHRKLSGMDRGDKVRACYQHACLQYVSNQKMTNTTLRKRFALDEKNAAIASRIIGDTLRTKLIKLDDPGNTSKKHARYLPYWA